jgi:flavin-dependent dehydrogenase
MTEPAARSETLEVDVAVVGGGLAGLVTATHLARRRRRVVCIEHRPWPRSAVGESLEFSAPGLLAVLGIDLDAGEPKGYLFPKTSVQISGERERFEVWPPSWFAGPPIWCSRLAYHTDRTELDQNLLGLALDRGVEVLPERVTSVERCDQRITGMTTDRGTRLTARWYVDATGHDTRLFGRALDLEQIKLGGSRIAYWARFDAPPTGHSTNLYMPRPGADQLTWAWEIPLNPSQVSVGVVLPTTEANACRASGRQPKGIFRDHIDAVPALRGFVADMADVPISATTYTPYRHRRCVGPNWLLVGDACAMVDPLTSNGVTAALRHADQAARLISDSLDDRRLGRCRSWAFEATAPATIETLDRAIEAFLYRPTIRQRLGLRPAVMLYAATGVVTNSLYAKLDPVTLPRAMAGSAMLAASRAWTRAASATLPRVAALLPSTTRTKS